MNGRWWSRAACVLTWRDLQARVHRLAHSWLGSGLRPGDRVAMYAPNCAEYVEFYFACAASGIAGAALNVRLAPGELVDYVSYVAPKAVLAHATLMDSAAEWVPRAVPSAALLGFGGDVTGTRLEALMAEAPDTPPDVEVTEDTVYQARGDQRHDRPAQGRADDAPQRRRRDGQLAVRDAGR